MPNYRRLFQPGGTFFFTVVLDDRRPLFAQESARRYLHEMMENYIHYNPIKHALARCPHAWPWSSFHRWVEQGYYKRTWLCDCDGPIAPPPDLMNMPNTGE